MTDHATPVTGYPAHPIPNGAHPYPAPPPPPNQPPYFNISGHPAYPNQQRTTFLRRFFSVFIGIIILIGSVVFITWLVLRPQIPKFRLQTLTLTNFNVTSNSMISGNWNAGLTVRNPNSKITLYYDHIEAAVFYKSRSVAMTSVAPFVQGKKNETSIRATFVSVSKYLDDSDNINKEKARGTVDFNLMMVARVRFRAGAWWTRRRILRIYCPNLPVNVSANSTGGSLTGGSRHCRVDL